MISIEIIVVLVIWLLLSGLVSVSTPFLLVSADELSSKSSAFCLWSTIPILLFASASLIIRALLNYELKALGAETTDKLFFAYSAVNFLIWVFFVPIIFAWRSSNKYQTQNSKKRPITFIKSAGWLLFVILITAIYFVVFNKQYVYDGTRNFFYYGVGLQSSCGVIGLLLNSLLGPWAFGYFLARSISNTRISNPGLSHSDCTAIKQKTNRRSKQLIQIIDDLDNKIKASNADNKNQPYKKWFKQKQILLMIERACEILETDYKKLYMMSNSSVNTSQILQYVRAVFISILLFILKIVLPICVINATLHEKLDNWIAKIAGYFDASGYDLIISYLYGLLSIYVILNFVSRLAKLPVINLIFSDLKYRKTQAKIISFYSFIVFTCASAWVLQSSFTDKFATNLNVSETAQLRSRFAILSSFVPQFMALNYYEIIVFSFSALFWFYIEYRNLKLNKLDQNKKEWNDIMKKLKVKAGIFQLPEAVKKVTSSEGDTNKIEKTLEKLPKTAFSMLNPLKG